MMKMRHIAVPLLLALLILSGFGLTLYAQQASPGDAPSTGANTHLAPAETIPVQSTIYLPTVINRQSPAVKVGADFGHMTTYQDVIGEDYAIVQEFGGDWIRVWLSWSEIERSPGVYDWSAYDPVFAKLDELGMKALVLVFNPPSWAADQACGPISNFDALYDFIGETVPRYQATAAAWEFINEPDGHRPHPYGPVIGCWGPYPQEYARALQRFYAAVKDIDPNALVFFGGLAYDAWDNFDRDFLANTLDQGAGDFFDGLSFHFYPINAEEFPDASYKLKELRAIMAERGVYGKYFWITEMSMWANSDTGLDGQQDFIVKDLTRAYCTGVDNIFWFAIRQDVDFPPPLHRWLIDADHNPDLGHVTYSHYNQRVKGGYCFGQLSNLPPEVEAYRFDTDDGPVIIAWTSEGNRTLTVEAGGPQALLDREGNLLDSLTPTENEIEMPLRSTPRFLVRIREE